MATRWNDEGDNSLWVITPTEYEKLPNNIELECINGKTYIKGKDYIDQDVRGGHIAYGIRNPFNGKYKDELLLILLANNSK
jgi:hypothetical protein